MEEVSRLLYKYLKGTLNEAERIELMTWVTADPDNRRLLNRIDEEETLKADIQDWYTIPKRSVTDDPQLDNAIAQHEATIKHARVRQRVRRLLSYAALFFIALMATWYVFDERGKSSEQELAAATILPGGNKATLTLANGKKFDLSAGQSEIIVGDRNVTYGNGASLTTLSDEDVAQGNSNQLELTTPKGGTYRLTLSDGSKVWLNAASTIKYPNSFTGKERVVEVNGEAYFNIKEDRNRPFKVLSRDQEVQVLGTEFNIEAYSNENETKTTLVTGKVLISLANGLDEGAQSMVLAPGEQGILRNGNISKQVVDVSPYTAWKDGFFYFNRLSTPAAIRQLARWYDLDVVYEGKIPSANVFANIDRGKPLSAVLTALEKSGLRCKVIQSGQRKQLIVLGEQ